MQISSWVTVTLVSATFFITLGWANLLSPAHEQSVAYAAPTIVLPTATDAPVTTATIAPAPPEQPSIGRATPLRVRMPAIGLDSAIANMGLNDAGEMDVPDGSTNDVGWYAYGTIPGNAGSAVFDAHVYAAFRDLHRAQAGDEIYVDMSNGETLRFVISQAVYHRLDSVPREELFNRADGARLNLITCAGDWDASRNTYDHRLIVSAVFAD